MVGEKQIVKTITACIPGTACNFNCDYCYIGHCVDDKHFIPTKFEYSVEHMVKAFSPERLGGIANIIVIGNGETLLPSEIVPFIKGLLKLGHFVEVATNLTLNDRVEEMLDIPENDMERLMVRPSFHYLELKRLNKLDDFFNNVNKILKAGASCIPFMVICDSYMPYLKEIKNLFIDKIGALPQVTPTLTYTEKNDIKRFGRVQCSPELSSELRNDIKDLFESEVFELCCDFIDVDPKKTFCYAGKWSFSMTLDRGYLQKCHGAPAEFSMFEDLDKIIDLEPIGKNCCINTCALQYQFIALGLLDGYNSGLNYYQLMSKNGNRESLFNEYAKKILNFKYPDFMNV